MEETLKSLDRDAAICPHQTQRHKAGYRTKERSWGLWDGAVAVLDTGGLFTSQNRGLCHYVISLIHVCFCSETHTDGWLNAIQTSGKEPGKESVYRIRPKILRMQADYQSENHNLESSEENIHQCTKPLQPFQGHVPTATSMRTT